MFANTRKGWEDKFDLLSSETALPTDRTQPKTYAIEFETPVYSFRFYSEYYGADYVSGSNRGRICIGDMILQFQRSDYMPLNWSELEYEPEAWGDCQSYTNCYAYALNVKYNPDPVPYYAMQPGQSGGKDSVPNISYSDD